MGFPAHSKQGRCDVFRHLLFAPDPLQINPASAMFGDPGYRVSNALRAISLQIEEYEQAFGGTPDDRSRDDLFKKGLSTIGSTSSSSRAANTWKFFSAPRQHSEGAQATRVHASPDRSL